MRRLAAIAVALTVFAFVPVTAQNDSGHVFVTLYYKALPGQGELYNRYVLEYGFPYYDELVRRGQVVSFKIVYGWTGTSEWTHMLIEEYENWDAVDTPVDAPEVCRAVLGMTCVEKQHEIGIENLEDVRVFVRRELWGSLRP